MSDSTRPDAVAIGAADQSPTTEHLYPDQLAREILGDECCDAVDPEQLTNPDVVEVLEAVAGHPSLARVGLAIRALLTGVHTRNASSPTAPADGNAGFLCACPRQVDLYLCARRDEDGGCDLRRLIEITGRDVWPERKN